MNEAIVLYVHWRQRGANAEFMILYSDGTWESFKSPFPLRYLSENLSVKHFMKLSTLSSGKYTKGEARNYILQKFEEGKKIIEESEKLPKTKKETDGYFFIFEDEDTMNWFLKAYKNYIVNYKIVVLYDFIKTNKVKVSLRFGDISKIKESLGELFDRQCRHQIYVKKRS